MWWNVAGWVGSGGVSWRAGTWHGRGMSEIVNLHRERKRRGREAAAQQAAENRAVHGQTRAERGALEQAARRRAALLDGARLEADAAGDAGSRDVEASAGTPTGGAGFREP